MEPTTPARLTRDEARERARLLSVDRYDIEVDLTGLLTGDTLATVSRVSFRCSEPGAATFVDCVADAHRVVLNGRPVDRAAVRGGRIELAGLEAENVLEVEAWQSDTASSAGILRSVDPADGLVYVWTSLECDEARRLWACFDQPDLKAPHAFTVAAPESWTVTSNMRASAVDTPEHGARRWTFPDTPPLSTYVVVVNAGPFHEIRERRGDHSLGLYCRQSLRPYLERDADWLLDLTGQGLAFYADGFGRPFPEAHYDQVFVPNMGGAMENWGCVTWTDAALVRSTPTHSQREEVAMILLHEMAHMWFGDLVTMRWWDDLWLNEAFASWAACWAMVGTGAFPDAWASFLAGDKVRAYRQDMGPATHPIRGDVPDVSFAMANFDAITYLKGQSVLRQLMAFAGEDAFTRGLRAYFEEHAWGNTVLTDLTDAIGAAAGRDLAGWTEGWLDSSGTDTLTVDGDALVVTAPDGGTPRSHRVDVGCYGSDGRLLRMIAVETEGARTALPVPPEGRCLPNATDLTYAAVRTADSSLVDLLAGAGRLPDPMARAVTVTAGWDMLAKGELSAARMLDALLAVLESERSPALLEALMGMARETAELWTPAADRAGALTRVADTAAALAEHPDLRLPALQVLAACAGTPSHDALLDEAAVGDVDLAWRTAVRRAERGEHDAAAVQTLLERDPDPDARFRAMSVAAARPEAAAKDEAWDLLFGQRAVPAGSPTREMAQSFWRPGQEDVLFPYADRYLTELGQLGGGMLSVFSLVRSMYPLVADRGFPDRSDAAADDPALEPTARSVLRTGADTLRRMLRSRGVLPPAG